MADLKTPYTDPLMDAPGLDGSGDILVRGGDPQIDTGGVSGLQGVNFQEPLDPAVPDKETGNSVSGLPALPNRWEPAASSEQPPDLTDRSPGTIDRR